VAQDGAVAVLNADAAHAERFLSAARARGLKLMTVGVKGDDIKLTQRAVEGFAQAVTLVHAGRSYPIRLPLVGAFQVENAALAAGLAIVTGGDPARAFAALEHLQGAKGRLELVRHRNGAPIFIDYAHKPDALAKALEALRPYASGRLIVVFGAGGDRDAGKRPLMGAIAAENADAVIVTDDNPRSENPKSIRAAILSGAKGATEIGDRATAIRTAIENLEPGDALLIAGKGHETGQIVGDRVLPFSDHEAARAALTSRVA
jgi:UDP-N-acetylmuramoyl-L-alanyl-D-glutamate--2,6-diaminopimelate ligase